jgi:putative ABC transport system permease protein
MFKLLTILWNSFKMALGELKNNKLRTFLSLFGITIGIFCIIGVLATVDSLEQKVQNDIKSFGGNTIYIDKWQYGQNEGGTYPWWKYINRPAPKNDEVEFIRQRSNLAQYVSQFLSASTTLSYKEYSLNGVGVYGVTDDFDNIQTIDIIQGGRYLSDADFRRGTPAVVIGHTIAQDLIGNPDRAAGKEIKLNGKTAVVVGVIQKQGQSFVGGFDYDNCVILSYRYYATMFQVNPQGFGGSNFIMVKARDNVSSKVLVEDLRGVMRQIRRLSPKEEDNFALNDINLFSEQIGSFFGMVNKGGWAIAGLSLIVGAFGVANIMFVTVRERTSQIGLKKAIGAKKRTILTEFLIESAFLCVIGGLIGLLLVWVLTLLLSSVMPFPIVIAPDIVILAFVICVILGVISGIIPAFIAAKMNPVKAIRTT